MFQAHRWHGSFPYHTWRPKYPKYSSDEVSPDDLNRAEIRLAWQEFLRRPTFHTVRIIASTLTSLFELDSKLISWSLTAPGVLPQEQRKTAIAFRNTVMPVLQIYPLLVQILFATALFFASGHRALSKWIGPMLLAILLKARNSRAHCRPSKVFSDGRRS